MDVSYCILLGGDNIFGGMQCLQLKGGTSPTNITVKQFFYTVQDLRGSCRCVAENSSRLVYYAMLNVQHLQAFGRTVVPLKCFTIDQSIWLTSQKT